MWLLVVTSFWLYDVVNVVVVVVYVGDIRVHGVDERESGRGREKENGMMRSDQCVYYDDDDHHDCLPMVMHLYPLSLYLFLVFILFLSLFLVWMPSSWSSRV